MRNLFADGRLIEDAAEAIKPVRRSAEEAELYDAAWKLEAPFPPIEVLRWRCKLRDETTGRPLLDDRGREMFEQEESWFTLDNRRLFCLQKAALRMWPEQCTADVIAEVRKDRRMREIRKFRTMDNGESIMVGSIVDGVPFERWGWRAEVSAGRIGNNIRCRSQAPTSKGAEQGQKGRSKGKGKGYDGKGGKGGKGHGKSKGEDADEAASSISGASPDHGCRNGKGKRTGGKGHDGYGAGKGHDGYGAGKGYDGYGAGKGGGHKHAGAEKGNFIMEFLMQGGVPVENGDGGGGGGKSRGGKGGQGGKNKGGGGKGGGKNSGKGKGRGGGGQGPMHDAPGAV
mmetsp:Transcript_37967/g.88036  ORF Transcript_37967/g.88036 Transcript_37967/m.88036 type:complete len:341 (+) Transcript_37967:3-1025(+)